MRFAFTDEQAALQRAARSFLQGASSPRQVREAMATERGWDDACWARATGELGWAMLPFPEEHGGAGVGWVEVGIILEETGRALLCSPLFATVCLGGCAILLAGSEAQRASLLPGIAAGETTATLALSGGEGWSIDDVAGEFERDGEGLVLRGAFRFVPDGGHASLLVVAARERGDGPPGERPVALFAVPADHPGVTRRATPQLDLTRRVGDVTLDAVRVAADARLGGGPLAPGSDASAALAGTLQRAAAMLACEQVGAAEACLEMAVAYAKVRRQFNRPIGSFQAIKHMCADMLLEVETARSAACYAAWAAATDAPDLASASAQAKAVATDALTSCAGRNIQIHGGIGFTWEQDAHLYFKRARGTHALLGTPAAQREAFAREMGL
jgi:alkylation response protein AidB-like acyl-CoA dehydrogenase